MEKFYCFSSLLARKKKKLKKELASNRSQDDKSGEFQVKPAKPFEFSDKNSIKEAASNVQIPMVKDSQDNKKESLPSGNELPRKRAIEVQGSHESTPTHEQNAIDFSPLDGIEGAYEGNDEALSTRRESDFNLKAQADSKDGSILYEPEVSYSSSRITTNGEPWTAAFVGSPKLKRSCSNIETRSIGRPSLSSSKSFSYDDLRHLEGSNTRGEVSFRVQSSHLSAVGSCSASQVLPSWSRMLWLKLSLWSHRNLHKSWVSKPRRPFPVSEASNQKEGYATSDEPDHSSNNQQLCVDEKNQWVAFLTEASPFDRVNGWVNSLDNVSPGEDAWDNDDGCQTQVGESSQMNLVRHVLHIPEGDVQAINIMKSLNTLSSEAHICGKGLKVLPAISAFSNLKSVNLSKNFIVHITSGSLPKSLHTLDLSRNNITTIEGLRDLIHLRVFNISYNRISKISHGLSNCTLIKELYLAGNKISSVEGLHRLLKLNLLDLSFNKITMPKSLCQLAVNCNSLMALNLLGNPIQSNIGDDQLRRAVLSLLPKLTYLNKRPIKPQRATGMVTNSFARAALGDVGSRRALRQVTGRISKGSSSGRGSRSERTGYRRSKSRHY